MMEQEPQSGHKVGGGAIASLTGVGVLLIFIVQNTESVNVSFLSLGMTLPLTLVVLVVYVLGALTGGSLYALLRRSIQGSRRTNS